MNDHPYDDISAFALGSLDEDAQRRVLEHADSCPSCAVLVAESMSGVGALAQLEEPRAVTRSLPQPSAQAPERSVTSITRPRRSFTLAGGWVAAAALAASLVLLLVNTNALRQPSPVPIGALVHSHFVHHQLAGTHGTAKVLQSADGRWIYLLADGLVPGARYEVFAWYGDASGQLGTFAADRQGQAAQFYVTGGLLHNVVIVPSGKAPTDADALHWP
jgi:hypothetical protein